MVAHTYLAYIRDHDLSPKGGGGGFWFDTCFKYLRPRQAMVTFSCTLTGHQTFLYTPLFLGSYTMLIYTSAEKFRHKRMEIKTENNSVKFKTHKYNAESYLAKCLILK